MKNNLIFLLIFWTMGTSNLFSQQNYTIKSGMAEATSETMIATILTKNSNLIGAMDLRKGTIDFQLRMDEFQFKSRLMQEHFNDWFIESEKYPTATFIGKVDASQLDFEKSKRVELTGYMELHGVTNKITTMILLEKNGNQLTASGEYTLKLDDYNVDIPGALTIKLANEISVKINLNFELVKPIVQRP